MASDLQNLSEYHLDEMPDLANARVGLVVSEWNADISNALYTACRKTLTTLSIKKKNIVKIEVPGSFELPGASKMLIETKKLDAIICLGCIIQGETRHFEFIAKAVASGIMDLNLRYATPVIFGVLTTDNLEQAQERAGGKHGNKGVEAAVAAVKLMLLKRKLLK